MKACVVSFNCRNGTGTQTVTGVVDSDGNPFTGHTLIALDMGVSTINVLETSGGAYGLNLGVDTGTLAGAAGDADVLQSGAKICSSGQSTNRSIFEVRANIFFGGDIFRAAKVTAWHLGSFDLQFDINVPAFGPVTCLVLGGSDLVVDLNNDLGNNTYPTTGAAQGVLVLPATGGANSSSGAANATTGAGGGPVGIGWDTRDGVRGALTHHVINQAGNNRQQRSDSMYIYPSLSSGLPAVTTWGPTSYDVTGASGGSTVVQMAFSGTGIQVKAGVITQPTATGDQIIVTGMTAPRLFILASYGAVSGTTLLTDMAQVSMGYCDRTRQGDIWTGENGVDPTVNGARIISDNKILRFATPAGAGTSFTSLASFVSMGDGGAVTINWSAVDGTEREILWFALGDSSPTPPEPGTQFYSRRLRRFPLPFDRSYWVFVSRMELLIQPGEGLSDSADQGYDPQIEVRFSGDGGRTWGNVIQVPAGKLGDYMLQPVINRIGKLRNGLCEISVSDPIYWYFLSCYVNVRENIRASQ